jgi:hypothetical protein
MASMLKLTPQAQRPSSRHRGFGLLLLMILVASATLLIERFGGQLALRSWQSGMEAKGEVFDPHHLWPVASTASLQFSNNLAQAVSKLPRRLSVYAGPLSGIVPDEAGIARRGSQEAQIPLPTSAGPNITWEDLDGLLEQSRPALVSMRLLMKTPPSDIGYDPIKRLQEDSIPNFVAIRLSAQALHAAAINDLHKGDLSGAQENLVSLVSFGSLYANDPGLVNFMIRIAIIGLSVDGCWDALQANGWTDQQLAALQQTCEVNSRLLLELPRVMEAERIIRCYRLNWFRSHSYETALSRYKELYESFGCKPPAAYPLCRQWVFHPVWSVAWSYQEELNYLRDSQPDVQSVRETLKQRSWVQLKGRLDENHKRYKPPPAPWRFYMKLPLAEELPEVLGGASPPTAYPYTDFSKAFFTSMKNLTLNEMVLAAIAIKRYELSHGKPPSDLTSLVPEFLGAAPVDLMDGQVLRYRLNSNGTFLLYSVGENGKDDGGDSEVESSTKGSQNGFRWNGRDWVWPASMQKGSS